MKRIRLLTLLTAAVFAPTAAMAFDTALENLQVPDSFIVTFKPTTNIHRSPVASVAAGVSRSRVPFGEHGTGQSRSELAAHLGVREVVHIFDAINAVHVRTGPGDFERLTRDPRIMRIEPNLRGSTVQTTQQNPGWALDRLDQAGTALDGRYLYNADGWGRTIYILDTGLDLGQPGVVTEFGGRASVIWDIDGAGGRDCNGHGTQVASAAAGRSRGVAKAATVIVAKITTGCTGNSDAATWAMAFNWLAANAPRGSIVNLSSALSFGNGLCGNTAFVQAVDDAIRAAFNAGIIVVVSAGNDGCNTANFTPTRTPEAFVVGATDASRLAAGQDARAAYSRVGGNVSVFAPGTGVSLMNFNGAGSTSSGTSFSAPYIAGMFAVACQAAGTFCNSMPDSGAAYDALRRIGRLGSVVNADGTPLPAGTTSRFISRQPW